MNLVLRRHANADRIICVNDSYDQDYSIKDSESILRRKQLPIRNVFMKAEDKFPSSRDFQALLGKPENKIRLQAFLQNEFKRTAATTDTEIIYWQLCELSHNGRRFARTHMLPSRGKYGHVHHI